jgi:hypothetical protein
LSSGMWTVWQKREAEKESNTIILETLPSIKNRTISDE